MNLRLHSVVVPALLAGFGLTATIAAADPVKGIAGSKPMSATTPQSATKPVWRFEERIGREDPFYDLEAILIIRKSAEIQRSNDNNPRNTTNPLEDALLFLQREESRAKTLLAERKYEEVVQVAEAALKQHERFQNDPAISRVAALIAGYRTQAQDAIDRIDAEKEFKALTIRVQGILWAEVGSKLALLSTDAAPKKINDSAAKDKVVIIAIDSDRVDFRFVHSRSGRRFEFSVYVSDTNAPASTSAR